MELRKVTHHHFHIYKKEAKSVGNEKERQTASYHQKEASEISRPQRRQKFARQGGDKEVGVTPSTGPTLEASPEARRRPQCPKPAGLETRLGLARMESQGERAWLFSE